MTRPGILKNRISISRPSTATDAYGGNTVTLTPLGTFWASVNRLGGARSKQYEEVGFNKPFEIVLRQNVDLLEDDEITFDNMTLVIRSVVRDYDRFAFQTVVASARYSG